MPSNNNSVHCNTKQCRTENKQGNPVIKTGLSCKCYCFPCNRSNTVLFQISLDCQYGPGPCCLVFTTCLLFLTIATCLPLSDFIRLRLTYTQYPPTLKLSKSSYSHLNYIYALLCIMCFNSFFFKQKIKSVDCYYCRKITKNCFTLTFDLYRCIWMFLNLIVVFQGYKKNTFRFKGYTLFNI